MSKNKPPVSGLDSLRSIQLSEKAADTSDPKPIVGIKQLKSRSSDAPSFCTKSDFKLMDVYNT